MRLGSLLFSVRRRTTADRIKTQKSFKSIAIIVKIKRRTHHRITEHKEEIRAIRPSFYSSYPCHPSYRAVSTSDATYGPSKLSNWLQWPPAKRSSADAKRRSPLIVDHTGCDRPKRVNAIATQ